MAAQKPKGYRIRGGKIQICFKEKGNEQRTYKTLDPALYPNTATGIKAACDLREKIRFEIRHGTYNPANYWEEDRIESSGLFAKWAQLWLDLPEHGWSYNTRRKYKGILNKLWMPYFHAWDVSLIEYSDLHEALSEMNAEKYSESYYNDILVVIRGVLGFYAKSKKIENPAIHLNNKKRVSEEPDPFSMDEAVAIIKEAENYGWREWFQLGFFTGLRSPGEMLGLKPTDIQGNELTVRRQRLHNGQIQAFTKTRKARTVKLNALAKQAIDALGDENEFLFQVASNTSQMKAWKRILEKLNIRYRVMYNMRHSFACFCLMQGQNPAYIAAQLGHSLEEFFRTYAKWINQLMDEKQANILDAAISKNKHIAGLKVQPKIVVDNTK